MSKCSVETKLCHTCGVAKPPALFPKWRLKCRACKATENSARLKERYAMDPDFVKRQKQKTADWQRENAERANEYQRRRHAKKVAEGDRVYLTKQAETAARYGRTENGRTVNAARMKQYEESGRAKAWRAARAQKPESRTSQILAGARNRAVKAGAEFSITFDDVYPALVAGRCPRTGLAFDLAPHADLRRNPLAPSLDRIDSTKGYVRGNVQIVCNWYNLAKHELPEADFVSFCRAVVDNAPKPDV